MSDNIKSPISTEFSVLVPYGDKVQVKFFSTTVLDLCLLLHAI